MRRASNQSPNLIGIRMLHSPLGGLQYSSCNTAEVGSIFILPVGSDFFCTSKIVRYGRPAIRAAVHLPSPPEPACADGLDPAECHPFQVRLRAESLDSPLNSRGNVRPIEPDRCIPSRSQQTHVPDTDSKIVTWATHKYQSEAFVALPWPK